jgi:uncharacterized protein YajQ (UPF0234 family)
LRGQLRHRRGQRGSPDSLFAPGDDAPEHLDRPRTNRVTASGQGAADPRFRARDARRAPRTTQEGAMAQNSSFDVSTNLDLQEVDNAVNQATKEIAQRYDFKGTKCTIELDRKAGVLELDADDEYRLKAVQQVLREKLSKRGVPLKNLDEKEIELGSMGRARQIIGLKQGIDSETAKKISKEVRDQQFKKVQVQIQGEELRVMSPSKDTLQDVMKFLRSKDFGVELKFGNYR